MVECDFILDVLWSMSLLASNLKGIEKIELLFQRTVYCQNLRYESLTIIDLKYNRMVIQEPKLNLMKVFMLVLNDWLQLSG